MKSDLCYIQSCKEKYNDFKKGGQDNEEGFGGDESC